MKTLNLEYRDGDTVLEGYLAYDEKDLAKKPVILVFHDWSGRNKFACLKAEKLAALGYVGFAVDMFGKGKIATTKEEKMALIEPFMQDRNKLQKRCLAAFETIKNLEPVNPQHIGAIGFCFGGLCALDLARSGADLKGIVSFHGLLIEPQGVEDKKIKAKILVLHGWDDPMVTPDHVRQFATEMTQAKADWQMNLYGHAMHAFTNPEAQDPDFGTVYNKKADLRSWRAMEDFFKETFTS